MGVVVEMDERHDAVKYITRRTCGEGMRKRLLYPNPAVYLCQVRA